MSEGPAKDPLFAALTRPPTILGVPGEAFALIATGSLLAFMASRSAVALPVFPALYGIARILCAKDPRFFRYLFLAMRTKATGANRSIWKGSSYAPFSNRKR
ncbi:MULTISPECIES: VirB3 family type IV secretion system protein [Xanthomonas]|uniref:type IV secretion system protein VirB3 n=1 Tax=Xanthomonas TaxID=338 RepID=UPI001C488BC2|nr:VirB3 family type IV secretion system protein [Xanthomonas campestris pv. mirabilis]MBV6867920.1 VirB3 family type IV secretion system protein [Xanthomonas campestris pv. coriandri]